jgi:hypothetical protein
MGFLGRRKRQEVHSAERAEADAQARALERTLGTKIDVMSREEMREHAWGVAEEIGGLYPDALPEKVETAQRVCAQSVFGPQRQFSAETQAWAMSLSKLGYLTRVVEESNFGAEPHVASISEALQGARDRWEQHDWWGIVNRFAGTVAAEADDPLQATWNVPGLGGDFRGEVVRALLQVMLEDTAPPTEMSPPEWTSCWAFGFFFRCGEMSLPDNATI